MNATNVAIGIIVALLTVAGLLGAAWPYFRGKQAQAYTELLEKSLAAERVESKEAEARCNEKIAELRGRVTTMTDSFATVIAKAVVDVVKENLTK